MYHARLDRLIYDRSRVCEEVAEDLLDQFVGEGSLRRLEMNVRVDGSRDGLVVDGLLAGVPRRWGRLDRVRVAGSVNNYRNRLDDQIDDGLLAFTVDH